MISSVANSPPIKSRSFNPFNRSKDSVTTSSTPSSGATSPSISSIHRFNKPRPFHKLTKSTSAKLADSLRTSTSAQPQSNTLDGFNEDADEDAGIGLESAHRYHPIRDSRPQKTPPPTAVRPLQAQPLAPSADISSETESQVSTSSYRIPFLHNHRHPSPHRRGRSTQSSSTPSSRPSSRDPTLVLKPAPQQRSQQDSPAKERGSTMFLQSFKTGSNSAAGRVTDFFSRTFRRDSSLTRDEKAFTGAGLGIQEEGPFVPTVINLPLLDQARRTRPLARIADAEDKTQIWMPALAWRCIQYLNERAVKEEGLYRISGSQVKVVGYQRRFDRELDINLLADSTLFDPNIISTLFKAWLRELPEEILPRSVQMQIMRVTPGSPMYISEEEMRKIEQAAILNNLQEDDDESSDPISRRSSAISLTPSAANAVLSNGNTHGSSGSHEVDGDGAQRAGALSKGRVSLESSLHGLSEAPSHSSHPLPALPSLKQNTRSPDRVSKPTKKADARVRSPILAASKSAVSKTSRDGSSDYPALQSLLPTQHQPTYLNPAEPVPPALIDALLNLPPPNYYLLFATTAHLAHLLKYQSKNKMSLSNIMICIGPALKIENFILGWLLERWRDCWVGPAVPTGNVTADGAGNEGGSNGPRGEEEALRRENEWEEQRDGVLAEEEGDEVTDRVEAVTNGGRTMESPGPEARKEPGHHKLRRSTERLAQSKGR